MMSEIKDYVSKCETCQSFGRKQCKQPLISHDVPDRPWAKVAMDVFTFNNKEYLVTVDYFSNLFEIDYLERATSKIIIRKLKQHFARHGIPETLVSDQATVFKSEQFKAFENEWDITHSYSSARYPQSKGKAENAIFSYNHLDKILDKYSLKRVAKSPITAYAKKCAEVSWWLVVQRPPMFVLPGDEDAEFDTQLYKEYKKASVALEQHAHARSLVMSYPVRYEVTGPDYHAMKSPDQTTTL
ncbi:uncharacterized protein K02A2.6-like [Dreissena polymorpha]|uniref:uncharacterized protein K02A2.6-like n=1 Tax=Dreissena polymorpha TaxID=45954 RepID=UPI0022650E1F|nr:uncharacterized protein K02A2.6-like [Dreissena polymorpha]